MNAIPAFLRPITISTDSTVLAELGHAAQRQDQIPGFSMLCQQEMMWCWAAVAQAIEGWRGQIVTQSEVASEHIAPGAGLICATPLGASNGQSCGHCDGSAGCGDAHALSRVLDGRGLLAPAGATNHVPSFSDVVDAINSRRPLPVRIHWPNGEGHFICVSGYRITRQGEERVVLYDPLSPGLDRGSANPIDMAFEEFSTAYDAANGRDGVPNYSYEVTP